MTNKFSPEKKERRKKIRTVLQGIILIVITAVTFKALFSFTSYKAYSNNINNEAEDKGFIALSYFGVDTSGEDSLISTKSLKAQLKALKENGYVTITQEDVLNYYNKGEKLPEKALLLLFEDGRRDTALFSQKVLEELNYKATMLSYGSKLKEKDSKYLSSKELLNLKKSTFWELGSNGYRLEFINVFDKKDNYLGNLTSKEFSEKAQDIERNYNHYLMDYIRDEYNIPKETYEEMKERISYDYEALDKIYKEELGKVPQLYALMHANTGAFGSNSKVSSINEGYIKEMFPMNFNREGFTLNTRDSFIYDLTRLQPQPHWSTNHLLMRIWGDTKEEMKFVTGDEEKAKFFEKVSGKAEYKDNSIVLTSLPEGHGRLNLKGSEVYKDIKVSIELKGNIIGSQGIYLRLNEAKNNKLFIQVINNELKVYDGEELLFDLNLGSFKGEEQDKIYDIKDRGDKKLDITLVEDKLSIAIDGKAAVENLQVKTTDPGSIALEAAWGEYGYSQRNLADDVYDGVFVNFKVTDMEDNTLYDNTLRGMDKIIYNVKTSFNNIVNWFIKNL